MEHIFFTGTLWPKEASDKSCEGRSMYTDVTDQQECQEICEQQRTCIGILYSYTHGFDNYCIVCRTDNLIVNNWARVNNFGFYRQPTGKDISYISQYS